MNLRLRQSVRLSVEYTDNTFFGSTMSPRLDESLCEVMKGLRGQIHALHPSEAVARGGELLNEFRRSDAFQNLLDGTGKIAERVLFPDPELCKPVAVHFIDANSDATLRFDVSANDWPAVHDVIALLAGDAVFSKAGSEVSEKLLPQLAAKGLVAVVEPLIQADQSAAWKGCPITWLGHNTAVIRSAKAAIVVDPWLFPKASRYPDNYQPIQRAELGTINALVITHSHPDHFDPGTLLQFGRDTTVIVPRVERESMLAADMAWRLAELGFSDVRVLDWEQQVQIADIEVTALPFYGEQPTSEEQLYPAIRNSGNAYLIRTPAISCAFTADCGRDSRGDIRDVALGAYRKHGPIDFLFSGYRGWRIYPLQLAESSVRSYLLFVPPDLYSVRQSLMSDAAEAIDTAEHWHARFFVPYADGGAPWFWEIGLGPKLDTPEEANAEWAHFDPMPERALEALAVRSAPTANTLAPSPVKGILMRPGDSLAMVNGVPEIVESETHSWPWKAAAAMAAAI